MRYISTRGGIAPLPFQDALMMGLARDGGLLVPERLPSVSEATLEQWQRFGYLDIKILTHNTSCNIINSHTAVAHWSWFCKMPSKIGRASCRERV